VTGDGRADIGMAYRNCHGDRDELTGPEVRGAAGQAVWLTAGSVLTLRPTRLGLASLSDIG
jgi:hypothetical protein